MFPIKFSSESLQIGYMDSQYDAYQYVGNHVLIYFGIFCTLNVFSAFLLRKIWPGNMIFQYNFYFFLVINCIFRLRVCVLLYAG